MTNEPREFFGNIEDMTITGEARPVPLEGRVGLNSAGQAVVATEVWAVMADPDTGALYRGPSLGYFETTPTGTSTQSVTDLPTDAL